MTERSSRQRRTTAETDIRITLKLDASGQFSGTTGIGFFDHMLDQVARHSLIDLDIAADGDRHIDDHHTVEDTGLAFGQALAEALGDKRGIVRYGQAYVPLDEALSRVVLDLSGRSGLYFDARFYVDRIGQFDVELVREFFQGLARGARATIHMDGLKGDNAHHIAETLFKAFARALRAAVSMDPGRGEQTPSTKERL